jgi:hypothetical protein
MMKTSRAMKVFATILTMAAFGVIAPHEGFASTYTLTPTDDALVYNNTPDINYGNDTSLSVYRRQSYDLKQRSFLKFDLTGMAAGESIVGATLHVYAYGFHTFGPLDTALNYVATDSWSEGTLTWNNQPAFGSQLDLKTAASWNCVYPTNNPQWGVWDLFAVPGAWQPATDKSDGYLSLLLKLPEAIETGNYNRSGEQFYSKDVTGDPQVFRPYLTITTQPVPEPSTLLLLGAGFAALIPFARRRRVG